MDESALQECLLDLKDLVDSRLESCIEQAIPSHGQVAELAGDVLLAGGKRLRPLLVILAYELVGGCEMEEILPLALAFEMIHTATLVHDDINDNAKTRRGIPTLHERISQEKALIAGDWLFVQGFSLGGIYEERVVTIMADCCALIASAEFKQIDHVMDLATSPDDYLAIVKGKTAGPFSAGCEGAALIAGASPEQREALLRFGMEMGISFQLVDDLLDIRGDERMGKPRGSDVYEGKMTLPLIHALTILHGPKRQRLTEIILGFNDSMFEELIELLIWADSISYTEILIKTHIERARSALDIFADSKAKGALRAISDLVVERFA
jgi:geranylgeranyl pyrophosphate synthase